MVVDFPVVAAAQATPGGGGSDGFVVKLNSTGSAFLWSTYLGGNGYDIVHAVVLRGSGQVAVTGATASVNFPVLEKARREARRGDDGFLTTYSTGGGMVYSTVWGGSGSDTPSSIAAGKLNPNLLLIGGETSSSDLTILNGYQTSVSDFGSLNGFWASFNIPDTAPKREQAGLFRFGGWALDKTGDFLWNNGDVAFSLGVSGDIPVIGDWDGSGQKRVGIFRDGVWYLDTNGDHAWDFGIDSYFFFGIGTDIPVVGDWAGIGKSCLGLYRNGVWLLDWNCNGNWDNSVDKIYSWGAPGDTPVVWQGPRVARAGLYNAGNWKIDMNADWAFNPAVDLQFTLGDSSEIPVLADFLGLGTSQYSVFRPSTGVWRNLSGWLGTFGFPGDVPIWGPW